MDENDTNKKTVDKPANNGFLIYSFSTKDRIAKWCGDESNKAREFPYKIKKGKAQREIKIYIA